MKRRFVCAMMTAVAVPLGCTPGGTAPGYNPDGTRPGVKAPTASCAVIEGKADRKCTPGAFNPNVTQDNIKTTICHPGWTQTVRPPSAYTNLLKTSQMQQYGETGAPADYEEDHLVSLSAGGAPMDPQNLFPQPWVDAHRKDTDEVRTQHDICAGRITLVQGQRRLLDAWTHP